MSYVDIVAGSSSPLTTKGDIWGYSTTDARLPVGSDTQVLTADSTQTLGIKWANASGGGLTWNSVAVNTNMASSNGYFVNSGSGAYNMTLPAPANGATVSIVDSGNNADTNVITIVRNGTEKINFTAASYIYRAKGGSLTIVSNGTDWFFI